MIIPRRGGDLNVKFRPCTFSELLGVGTIKKMLMQSIRAYALPHALLFTGPSGCGKTTAARLISLSLNCTGNNSLEYNTLAEDLEKYCNPCCECAACKSIINLNSLAVIELDAARTSDVGTVRGILDDLPGAPLGTERFKVLILDEAHNLSGKAEDALLKNLEDAYEHVYIILCTNLPQKLKEVTRNRCKIIQFNRLEDAEIYKLLKDVCDYEGHTYQKDVLEYIVGESRGVPRQSLTYLQLIAQEASWTKESASLIINAGVDIDHAEVVGFCKLLVKGESFNGLLKFYDKIKKIPPETIRISMRGYLIGCIKNARSMENAKKFHSAVEVLRKPYYNAKPEHDLISDVFKISTIIRGM